MQISEVSSFVALGPIVTALFGFLFLGEILNFKEIFGISIIVVGIYVLELQNTTKLLSPLRNIARNKYIHFVLYALVLYGVTDVVGKLVLSKYDFQPGVYLFYYQLFLLLFYCICLLFQKNTSAKANLKISKQNILLIILIAILTLGYRYFHLAAVKLTSIGIALAIHRSSTLITTIAGGKLFKEGDLVRKSIAALAVIVGVIFIVI
jgi:drug/metabolite transporter (DMT)-like permease